MPKGRPCFVQYLVKTEQEFIQIDFQLKYDKIFAHFLLILLQLRNFKFHRKIVSDPNSTLTPLFSLAFNDASL